MSNPIVTQQFEEARAFFRKHVGAPSPEDIYEKQQWGMAGMHLILIEGVYSVYLQAEKIVKADEVAFAFYALACFKLITVHHLSEEKDYLPALEPEFKSTIVDEHALFINGLEKLEDYFLNVYGGPNPMKAAEEYYGEVRELEKVDIKYDGKQVVAWIEEIAEPLLNHFQQEIDYLAPEKLKACGLTPEKLQIALDLARKSSRQQSPLITLPMLVGLTPPDCPFPPFPKVVRTVVAPYIFWWKYRSSWKFFPVLEPLHP